MFELRVVRLASVAFAFSLELVVGVRSLEVGELEAYVQHGLLHVPYPLGHVLVLRLAAAQRDEIPAPPAQFPAQAHVPVHVERDVELVLLLSVRLDQCLSRLAGHPRRRAGVPGGGV